MLQSEQTAQSYWRFCRAVTGRSGEPICARDAVEFFTLGTHSQSEAMRNACASTLAAYYGNVLVPAVTSFTTDGAAS